MSLETLLLYFFAAAALAGGVLMLVARHPMRVALALISSMVSLAGIYAILGVHVIAVFQVLIYVGAVMVFMVYVIMLLDVRDPSFLERYGRALVPSVAIAGVLAAALGAAVSRGRIATAAEVAHVQPAGAPDAFCDGWWMNVFVLYPAVRALFPRGGMPLGGLVLACMFAAQYGLLLLAIRRAARRPAGPGTTARSAPSLRGP
jgi:NADH-quinone oxidoreductase subunit J